MRGTSSRCLLGLLDLAHAHALALILISLPIIKIKSISTSKNGGCFYLNPKPGFCVMYPSSHFDN